MITVVTPPHDFKSLIKENTLPIFLAGTIDMGGSEDWQNLFIEELRRLDCGNPNVNILVLNPRRDFLYETFFIQEQIEWELSAMDTVEYIVMFLLGNSKSPVSMLEYGLFLKEKNSFREALLHLSVSKDFYRYDNVYHTNKHYGFPARFSGFADLTAEISEQARLIYSKCLSHSHPESYHKFIYQNETFKTNNK